jgi:hypothetical protein
MRKLQQAADRTPIETFFELHSSDQLDELGRELKVSVELARKKGAKVLILAASAHAGKLLPLPKSIKPLPEAAAAGGKKKKGAK